MAGWTPGYIYTLHLLSPLANPHSDKGHYIGWTTDVRKRIGQHATGNGEASRFMAECKRQGIRFVVGNLVEGTPADESRIKRQRNHKRTCLVCTRG